VPTILVSNLFTAFIRSTHINGNFTSQ